MGFLIDCDNKGCGKSMEPVLDVKTNRVLCSNCDKEVKSVTDFTKKQMKLLGQIKRDKTDVPFGIKCQTCEREGAPLIQKDKAFCRFCNQPMKNVTSQFIMLLKQNLGKQAQE